MVQQYQSRTLACRASGEELIWCNTTLWLLTSWQQQMVRCRLYHIHASCPAWMSTTSIDHSMQACKASTYTSCSTWVVEKNSRWLWGVSCCQDSKGGPHLQWLNSLQVLVTCQLHGVAQPSTSYRARITCLTTRDAKAWFMHFYCRSFWLQISIQNAPKIPFDHLSAQIILRHTQNSVILGLSRPHTSHHDTCTQSLSCVDQCLCFCILQIANKCSIKKQLIAGDSRTTSNDMAA